MMLGLRTDINGDKFMLRSSLLRLTPRDQIRSWSSYSIFDNIRKEGSQYEADKQAKYTDMGFVGSGLKGGGPENDN